MTDTKLPVDKLVAVYRKIRGALDAADEAYKAETTALKEQLEAVSSQLLQVCNEQGVDSLKAPTGTVTRRTVTRYWTSDWESMYAFIKENEVPMLLEQRIHNGNMKQFIEENPDKLPAGLNTDTKYAITVRKPTNK